MLTRENFLFARQAGATRIDAPWHAGMAYAVGYMKCALQSINADTTR